MRKQYPFCASSILLTAFVCLAPESLQAQTTAKVLKVDSATAALVPVKPPILLIGAKGTVSDAGWENARLVPYVYVIPPADGIWDFDFVADRVPGSHIQVLTPVLAFEVIRNPPDWVKGVRIHATRNEKEIMLGNKIELDLAENVGNTDADRESARITLEGKYESDGSKHCLVAKAKIKLGAFEKEIELGRFCVEASGDCVSGEKSIGSGAILHWKLCIKDGGKRLCLTAKACKDFGFPIGELCTPTEEFCVDIN